MPVGKYFFALCGLAVLLAFQVLAESAPPLRVVASFSVLADMVRVIGGEDVAVAALVGADRDLHGYQPTSADLKRAAAADLIIVNGLGFDSWMQRLLDSAEYKGAVVTAAEGVSPLRVAQDAGEDHGAHEDHGAIDPHAWHDLANGVIYAENIAAGLIGRLPGKAEAITRRKAQYQAAMRALDDEIRRGFAAIPQQQRVIVTSHDAFGYFGRAYGVRFLSPYGFSTESEPSAAAIAHLVDQIKKLDARKVFIENMTNPRLIGQLARDAGARIGGRLYSDALSPTDGEAPDYLAMMRVNAARLKAAMEVGQTR